MRTWPALAAVVVALALCVPGAASADAAAPGSISGTITATATGAPVAGARVDALQPYSTEVDGTATTGADGSYTISGLDPSDYTVCVDATIGTPSDPSDIGYQSRCYRDDAWVPDPKEPPPFSADQVSVSAGAQTSGIDLALPPAAALTGHVRDLDGAPVGGVSVYVLTNPPPEEGGTYGVATSQADGTYRVTTLPPTTAGYTVCFDASDASGAPPTGYLQQCYRHQFWNGIAGQYPKRPNPVPAQAGVVTRHVDAALRPAAGITGRIVDKRDGSPIATPVYLVQPYGNADVVSSSNANGRYVITGLRPSDHSETICFGGGPYPGYAYPHSATGYGGQCYDGVAWPGGSPPSGLTPIPVEAGAFATANARLGPGGEVHGTIRDTSGKAVPFADAQLFRADGQSVAVVFTNASGRYVLRDLTPGAAYILCAGGNGNAASQCFDHQAWNGFGAPPAGSAHIKLAPKQVRQIRFVLADT